MAKTVDNFATIEDFRKQYNELAYDVGEIDGLNDSMKLGSNDTVIDALNVLDNKQFFLQEFVYIAEADDVTFTGADNFANTLLFRKDKIQVYKNERHLVEDVDYIVASPDGQGNHESVVLQGTYASGQANAMADNDRLTIYSYTGAFIGTEISGSASSFFQKSAENTIYNSNANGVILNGTNSPATTLLESGYKIQLAGRTFAEDDIITTVAGKKFQAPIISDGVASLSAGSLTGAINITASGTVQAEQLTTTDDLSVGDDLSVTGLATIGETLGVTGTTTLTGALVANGNVDLGNAISDTITFGGTVDSHITPSVNNTQKVGNTTRKFLAMHAQDFVGALDGNAATATKLLTARNISGVAFDGTQNIELDTSHIDEDSSNLYFTNTRADTRADGRIAASDADALADINYTTNPTAGQILVWDAGNSYWEPSNNSNTTDAVSEGSNNKYFLDDRVADVLKTLSPTTHSNKGIKLSYNDNADGGGNTSLDGEITLEALVSNGVKLDGNDIELDYEVITDTDLSGGLPSGTSGDPVGRLYFLI